MEIAQKIRQGKHKNRVLRYKAVMEEFNKHNCRLMPISVIYREFIYPKFFISRGTLYQILKTSADEDFLQSHPTKTEQLSLF